MVSNEYLYRRHRCEIIFLALFVATFCFIPLSCSKNELTAKIFTYLFYLSAAAMIALIGIYKSKFGKKSEEKKGGEPYLLTPEENLGAVKDALGSYSEYVLHPLYKKIFLNNESASHKIMVLKKDTEHGFASPLPFGDVNLDILREAAEKIIACSDSINDSHTEGFGEAKSDFYCRHVRQNGNLCMIGLAWNSAGEPYMFIENF